MKSDDSEVFNILLTDKDNVPFVHQSANNIIHVLFPIISAYMVTENGEIIGGIASDNTCKTKVKTNEFIEKIIPIVTKMLLDLTSISTEIRNFFKKPQDSVISSLIEQYKNWQEIMRYVIYNHISVSASETRPLSNNRGRYALVVEEAMQKKDSRLKYFLIKPNIIDSVTYGDSTNPTCAFRRDVDCPNYKNLYNAFAASIDNIVPVTVVNIKSKLIGSIVSQIQNELTPGEKITPALLRNKIFNLYASNYKKYIPSTPVNHFDNPTEVIRNSICGFWPDPDDYNDPNAAIENISEVASLIEQVPAAMSLDDSIFETTDNNTTSAFSLFDKYYKAGDSSPEAKRKRKIDNLCILTQILIASINQYAQNKGLTEQNFGVLLDANLSLSQEFANYTAQACVASLVDGVEYAVCNFINQHSTDFGLNAQLSNEDILKISERYKREIQFIWTEDTPHFDEFVRLMPPKTPRKSGWETFIYYKAAFCMNMLIALSDQRLNYDRALQRLLNKFSVTKREIETIDQADITTSINNWNDIINLNIQQIGEYITHVIADERDTEANKLNFLLCKVVSSSFNRQECRVFELLPRQFYANLSSNYAYKNKLIRVQNRINNNLSLLNSYKAKLSDNSLVNSIYLTEDQINALNAARFDRKNYFADYEYNTFNGLTKLINDLRELGESSSAAIAHSRGYDLIGKSQKISIYPQPNNIFLLESDSNAINKIKEIIKNYTNIRAISMVEIACVYKHLSYNQHPRYQEMDSLNNNIPVKNQNETIRPLKIMKAFELQFEGLINIIRINSTLNNLEWLSESNYNNNKPKKGGAGCMAQGNPLSFGQLKEIYNHWHDRWPLTAEHEQALVLAVNRLRPDFYTTLSNKIEISRELQLSAALDLFGIEFYGLYFDKNMAIVQFNLRQQSKLKYVLHLGGFDKKKLPLNGDDLIYFGEGFTPKIEVSGNTTEDLVADVLDKHKNMRLQKNSNLDSNNLPAKATTQNYNSKHQLLLTPEILYRLYLAWIDIFYPESVDIMNYMSGCAAQKYLLSLATKYSELKDCKISDNFLVGTQEGVEKFNSLCEKYSRTVHCSTHINASLYQQVEKVYGKNSEVFAYVNEGLVNNIDKKTGHITKSHKILATLFALNLNLSNFRFNSEQNEFPEKKGGFGNIGEAENNTENVITYIQSIPDICANDFLINIQTELVIGDTFENLLVFGNVSNRRINQNQHPQKMLIERLIEQYAKFSNGKPRTDVESRLNILEIRLLLLGFSCMSLRLSNPNDISSEIIVTLNNSRVDGAKLKWFTQKNNNHRLNLSGVKETRAINPDDEGLLETYEPKLLSISPANLTDINGVRTLKNTWPITLPHVPVKYSPKTLPMNGPCPNADGSIPRLKTIQEIKNYVATLPIYSQDSQKRLVLKNNIRPPSKPAAVSEARTTVYTQVHADLSTENPTYQNPIETGRAFASAVAPSYFAPAVTPLNRRPASSTILSQNPASLTNTPPIINRSIFVRSQIESEVSANDSPFSNCFLFRCMSANNLKIFIGGLTLLAGITLAIVMFSPNLVQLSEVLNITLGTIGVVFAVLGASSMLYYCSFARPIDENASSQNTARCWSH